MKVILIAFACHPELGSESAAGWTMALLLAQSHQVHVVTQSCNRSAISRFEFGEEIQKNLTFCYVSSTERAYQNRMVARIMSWVNYKKWLTQAQHEFAQILRKEKPDLIHHVTIATWRVGIPWMGFGIPVVWGPLGGAAKFPLRFLSGLSFSGGSFEIVRNLGTYMGRMLPSVVKSCRSAAAIICANGLDAGFLNLIRGQGKGLYVLSSAHFSVNEVKRFEKAGERKEPYSPLQAFAGGICIGSKGIRFALEALALAREKGTRVEFTVASFGPELNFLKYITRKLKLCDQVQFHDGFRGEAYDRALGKSHVFLLPSFREGSPRTILEAMLAGVVPVVCKASAQGEIVDAKVGFAIPICSRHELVRGLADALILLDHDRELLQSMGRAARSKVSENYSEKTFLSKMESIYQETLQRKGGKQ